MRSAPSESTDAGGEADSCLGPTEEAASGAARRSATECVAGSIEETVIAIIAAIVAAASSHLASRVGCLRSFGGKGSDGRSDDGGRPQRGRGRRW